MRKKNKNKGKRAEVPQLSAPQEAWMVPNKICVKNSGRCNILVVVPHGFPGDDTNSEILGYHLAEHLQCYAVINNRKYMKETNSSNESGFVGDLFQQYYASRAALDYINPLIEIVESIHNTFEKPPLILFLGGMHGTPPLNPAPPFCAVQIDAGYANSYHPAVATARKETIDWICTELEKIGFVPWEKGSSEAEDSMLSYFKKKLSYPVEAIRIGIPFEGFRDNVEGLEQGAKLLAEAFRNVGAYEELEPGQFHVTLDKSLITSVRPGTDPVKEEPIDEELIQEAVIFINETLNKTIYKGAQKIGSFVLKKFFNNDINAAASRSPHKAASYRRLCEREDLLLSPGQLSVMVRVAAQEQFFSDSGLDVTALSYTHKAEFVKLQNSEAKLELVRETLEKGYSTRTLEKRVKEIREQMYASDVITVTAIARCVHNPLKLFDDPDMMDFIGNSTKLKKLPVDFRNKLHAEAFNMIEQVNEWKRKYGRLIRKLERIADKEKAEIENKGTVTALEQL